MKRLILILCCSGFVAACGTTPVDKDEITKEDASINGGRADDGRDWCAVMGWYDDGVCDDFCVKKDADCKVECTSDSDCGADQLCEDGSCEDVASTCTSDADCTAGDLCVNGTCEPSTGSDDCGGIAGLECEQSEVCIYEPGDCSNIADALGTCVVPPDACDAQYDPVCGCDGQTYGNACNAMAQGVSVDYVGECGATACDANNACATNEACVDGTCVRMCGGFAGFVCHDDEFCDYEEGDFCGAADALGFCAPRPEECAQVYEPVCGCDGQTYGNACTAHAAGIDDASEGECGNGPSCQSSADCAAGETCSEGICKTFCGGFAGFTCEVDEWCDYDDSTGSACGIADGGGVCEPRPEACAQVFDPVCGCDGQTYSNACTANAAGVDVFSVGPCGN